MVKLKPAVTLSLAAIFFASSASGALITLKADLTMGAESGPNTPATLGPPTTASGDPRPVAIGTGEFVLDTDPVSPSMTMTLTVFNIDVTGTQTEDTNDDLRAAHIHAGATLSPNGTY